MSWRCPTCGIVVPGVSAAKCGRCADAGRPKNHAPPIPYGPGTELAKLLASLGITEQTGCQCDSLRREMDALGVAGCRRERTRFLKRLEENAAKFSWWDKFKAGAAAVLSGLFPALASLFDDAILRAEATDAWQPVRHCLYHVAPLTANDAWRANVRQLLKRADLFTGKRIAAIATGPECHHPAVVREAFDGRGFEFLEVPNDKQLREVATFVPLLRQVEHEPGVTFYAHTKGNSTAENVKAATRWRNAMYHYLLDDFEPVRRALIGHTFCGTHKMKWRADFSPYPTRLKVGTWMHAGTFFWFRNENVFSNPDWHDLPADRYAAEAWPSMMADESAGWSLYQPWPASDRHPNPYKPDIYPAEFDDA